VFDKHEDYEVRFDCPLPGFKKALPILIRPNAVFDYPYVNETAKIGDWVVTHKPHYET